MRGDALALIEAGEDAYRKAAFEGTYHHALDPAEIVEIGHDAFAIVADRGGEQGPCRLPTC